MNATRQRGSFALPETAFRAASALAASTTLVGALLRPIAVAVCSGLVLAAVGCGSTPSATPTPSRIPSEQVKSAKRALEPQDLERWRTTGDLDGLPQRITNSEQRLDRDLQTIDRAVHGTSRRDPDRRD